MTKKYIDADKLIAEIDKKWKELADKNVKVGGGKYDIEIFTYLSVKNLITSLQQEQPEVEQDIANVVKSYFDVQELEDVKITTTGVGLLNFAKHIKKIVLSSAFILYNHITENSGNKTLDNEIDATIKMNDLWGGLLPNTLIKYTARHFAEWGAEHARKEE